MSSLKTLHGVDEGELVTVSPDAEKEPSTAPNQEIAINPSEANIVDGSGVELGFAKQ